MTAALSLALRLARVQQVADALDGAGTAASVLFYSGTRPAGGAAPPGDAELQCTVELAYPCGEVAEVAGVAVLALTTGVEGLRVSDDAIAWARFVDGDAEFVLDATVTGIGGGGDITISSTAGNIGGIVGITAGGFAE